MLKRRAVTASICLVLVLSLSLPLVLSADKKALAQAAYVESGRNVQNAIAETLKNHPSLRAADAKIQQITLQKQKADAFAQLIVEPAAGFAYDDPLTRMDAKHKHYLPKQAEIGLEIANAYKTALETNLALGTRQAFYNAAKYSELYARSWALVRALDLQQTTVSLLKKEGLATEADLALSEAKLSEAIYAREAYNSGMIQAQLTLGNLVGLAEGHQMGADVGWDHGYPDYKIADRIADALASRFEIFKAQKELELAQYDLALANTYTSSPLDVLYAQSVVDEAQAMLDHHTREVKLGVYTAQAGLKAAVANYGHKYAESFALFRALEATEAKEQEGLATHADVVLAESLYDQADAQTVAALCELEIARAMFEHASSKGSAPEAKFD